MTTDIIHYCEYASQPYIDMYCTGATCYVSFSKTDIEKVYLADGPGIHDPPIFYTFEWENVNCKWCLDKREK